MKIVLLICDKCDKQERGGGDCTHVGWVEVAVRHPSGTDIRSDAPFVRRRLWCKECAGDIYADLSP